MCCVVRRGDGAHDWRILMRERGRQKGNLGRRTWSRCKMYLEVGNLCVPVPSCQLQRCQILLGSVPTVTQPGVPQQNRFKLE